MGARARRSPATLTFEQPAGVTGWQVATQLHPGATPARVHRAEPAVPDGQPGRVRSGRRCASSPSTAATFRVRRCTTPAPTASSTLRAATSRRSCARRARSTASIPAYEPGNYTFLADYLPYANGDGMEHRNSTVMTSSAIDSQRPRGSARHGRARVLPRLERRAHPPATLEPFDFERANMSGELWLAEGFTQYYGPLALQRAGLVDLPTTARHLRRPRRHRSLTGPGRIGAVGRGDEPDGAVHRRRPRRSIARTGRTRSSRTTRSAARSRWRSI